MSDRALLVLALLACGAVAEEVAVTGTHTAWNPDSGTPPPLRAVPQALEFVEQKPADAVAAPDGTIQPRYTTIRIAGKTITLVMAKSDKQQRQPDRLLVDLHGDGKLHPVKLEKEDRAVDDETTAFIRTCTAVPIRIAGRKLPVRFEYRGVNDDPYDAGILPLWYLEATVEIGGVQYPLFAQDSDLDGVYGSDADLWFIPSDRARPKAMRPFLLTRFGVGRFLSGQRVVVTGGKGDRFTARINPAKGPAQSDLVSAREHARAFWFRLLAKDAAADGGQSNNASDSRPLTDKRIPWRYVTLKQAKALASKQKKPVFVDLHSLASGSCFHVCYTTFRDEEVYGLIAGRFIPVRAVRQENDKAFGEFVAALAAENLPSMGVIQPNGETPLLIAGWQSPAAMAYALRTALGEKVERDWTPFFGEFPFVVGYEAGMKEAKFTGRPPMLFAVSYNSAAGRKFAQRSFTMKLAGKLLDHYTPVLIDFDADTRIKKKYPVLITSPAIAWIDFDEEQIFMNGGDVPTYIWEMVVKIPIDRAPEHPVPAGYTALLKLRDELRAALKASDGAKARIAIAAIERVGQGVRVQAEAAAAKKKLDSR